MPKLPYDLASSDGSDSWGKAEGDEPLVSKVRLLQLRAEIRSPGDSGTHQNPAAHASEADQIVCGSLRDLLAKRYHPKSGVESRGGDRALSSG